jgi:hypothetical protein
MEGNGIVGAVCICGVLFEKRNDIWNTVDFEKSVVHESM